MLFLTNVCVGHTNFNVCEAEGDEEDVAGEDVRGEGEEERGDGEGEDSKEGDFFGVRLRVVDVLEVASVIGVGVEVASDAQQLCIHSSNHFGDRLPILDT